MPSSLLISGVAGVLLGLRFKIPALIAASAVAFLVVLAIEQLHAAPVSRTLLSAVASVLVLQGGYVIGLLLAFSYRRLRRPGE